MREQEQLVQTRVQRHRRSHQQILIRVVEEEAAVGEEGQHQLWHNRRLGLRKKEEEQGMLVMEVQQGL